MAIVYKVIFEKFKGKTRIAGVANNGADKNYIAGSISSQGIDYSAIMIDYSCNTPLNNDFFTVYVKIKSETEDPKKAFHEMEIKGESGIPTSDDLYLYKLEKSAQDRVKAINDSFTEEELKVKEAVMVPTKINTVYK